ncbi:uncharacterized protein SCHCODRAFT_02503724 [Schizophyllum commune H4-8]|nr:uncharacterized protein SCHCODRAFT_02503724 [Schizophyllum commune H4-8]KAI5891929.1 hypothetical protein SCHCODRAFT_02503724 [Schizophyllum commune H4-8]
MANPMDLPELREIIFDYFDPFDIRSVRLVCRSWYPEADQAFWRSAHNAPMIWSFLRLFPEDAWAEDMIKEIPEFRGTARVRRENFRFIRDLRPEDWIPVLQRTRFARVQTMASMANAVNVITKILACPPPGGVVLPNLKVLHVFVFLQDVELHKRLLYLINPSSLAVFTGMADENTVGPDPNDFASAFPHLTHVTLMMSSGSFLRWDIPISHARRFNISVVEALATCPRLSYVSLSLESVSAVDALLVAARSSSIKRLVLNIRDGKFPRQLIYPTDYALPAHSTLGQLVLTGLTLADARCIVERVCPRSVHTIDLLHADAEDEEQDHFAEDEGALFSALQSIHSQFLPYRSLRGLSLRGSLAVPATLKLDDIRMFAAFPNLTYLSLAHQFTYIALDDADCATIAGWWPKLRLFGVGDPKHPQEYLPECTLKAVLAFVTRCPEFMAFQMPLDATDIPEVEVDSRGRPLRYWSLTTLAVGDSPIDDGTGLGAYLSTVYPGLSMVDYRFPENGDEEIERQAEEWDRVKVAVTGKSASDPPEPVFM